MARHYNNRAMFPYLFRQKSRKNIRQIVAISLINRNLGKGGLKENPIFSDDKDKIWHVNSFFIIELAILLYYCATYFILFESILRVYIWYVFMDAYIFNNNHGNIWVLCAVIVMAYDINAKLWNGAQQLW